MITEVGRVVAVQGNQVWVQTIQASSCERCSARAGCGQRVLVAVSGGRANQVLVDNPVAAVVGDEVVLGIDDRLLLKASLAVYGMPLAGMLVATVFAYKGLGAGELVTVLSAVAGIAAGFCLARGWQNGRGHRFQPTLLKVNPVGTT